MILITQANANPLEPTLTKIFVQQDNVTLADVSNASVTCYGPDGVSPYFVSRPLLCQSDGCALYDQNFGPMMGISTCMLEGIRNGTAFKANLSHPGPAECGPVEHWDFGKERRLYSLSFDESANCYEIGNRDMRDCERFLQPEGNTNGSYGYTQINNGSGWTVWKRTPEYNQCVGETYNRTPICLEAYNRIVNQTEAREYKPSFYCSMRFTISPENRTFEQSALSSGYRAEPKSLVESLFCNFLRFFGGVC